MLNRIATISEDLAKSRKENPELKRLMDIAAEGQSPRYFLISPVNRSSQDLHLLQFQQGDAFGGTRVPGMALPSPRESPILFAGPAAYTSNFDERKAVIITFDQEESDDTIEKSLDSINKHPALAGVPIIALRIDYLSGYATIFPHGYERASEEEKSVLGRIRHPNYLDDRLLTVLCSDSRVRPPESPLGVSMSIQTLGAFVPQYHSSITECIQLDSFFSSWLSGGNIEQQILVVIHGNLEGTGPSCGAGCASMNLDAIEDSHLHFAISALCERVETFERVIAKSPEERVVNVGRATVENLSTYPAIQNHQELLPGDHQFIEMMKMDTVTNVVREINWRC
ncbi:hypothetical protein EU537_02580 [Candidatus Thorarchaeota archaeon]|nr:MAG: hypothetical protein EU537_02580 [Candidatus Thorarchaeota archaeon]